MVRSWYRLLIDYTVNMRHIHIFLIIFLDNPCWYPSGSCFSFDLSRMLAFYRISLQQDTKSSRALFFFTRVTEIFWFLLSNTAVIHTSFDPAHGPLFGYDPNKLSSHLIFPSSLIFLCLICTSQSFVSPMFFNYLHKSFWTPTPYSRYYIHQ